MHMIREFLSRVSLGRPRPLRRFALAVPLVIASFAAMADSEDATGADFAYVSGVRITFKGASTNWVDGEFVLKYDNPSAASELVLPTTVDAWILTVGGGGAGASPGTATATVGGAGGGGAGGYVENHNQRLASGTYDIQVGAGGEPSMSNEGEGGYGQKSMIKLNAAELSGLTAIGGGGGGFRSAGGTGGSGGGGSKPAGSSRADGGAGTTGQGNSGGSGVTNQAGAGGGGAGGVGEDTTVTNAGSDGGIGKPSNITGENVWYAGGGGGGSRGNSSTSSVGGEGGSGIGGHGGYGTLSSKTSATAGLDGTGSGGGGGCYNQAGGAGGSGVVIIRIRKVMPFKPSPTGLTWIYDGSEHAPVDVSDESHIQVESGTAAASNVGSYSLTVAPASGYVWSDGTTGPITLTWKILKRAVTLTSADDSWTYDGQAHSNTTVTVGGDGFVAGEGLATTSGWATITDVGTNDNTFAYTLLPNTRAGNYEISVVTGKISVVAASIDPADDPSPFPSGFDPADPGAIADPTKPFSAFDTTNCYDGAAHTIDTNRLEQAYADKFLGNTPSFGYSLTSNGTYAATAPDFTDATVTSLWYRVSAANFEDVIRPAKVIVTNRAVTITFTAADKVYDGTAAATCAATNFANVVAGEGFALDTSVMTFAFADEKVGVGKTVTATGYGDDKVAALEGTKKSNYAFTFIDTATASITAQPVGDVELLPVTASYTYDGTGKEPEPGVTNKILKVMLVPGTDYDYAWADNTNATAAAKVIATLKGNYAGSLTNTFAIAKRAATLESGSHEWTYDAKAHAYTNLTATGFVAGEGVATNGFATITDVGTAPNAFGYEFLANTKAENYRVTCVTGLLTVVAASVDPADDPSPFPTGFDPADPGNIADPTKPFSAFDTTNCYDGVAHTIDTNRLEQAYADKFLGNVPSFGYSLTSNGTYAATAPDFTDATVTSLWYRVSAANFEDVIRPAKVIVTNRAATITFTAADKVFDGTDAATCTATNFENVVEGEGFTLDTSAMTFAFEDETVGANKTVTATGYGDGLVTALEGTRKSNYTFSFTDTATASITAQPVGEIGLLPVTESYVYDGTGKEPAPGVTNTVLNVMLVPGEDYDYAYEDNTNAGTAKVIAVLKGNYAGSLTNLFAIAKRAATLTSGSASWTYNGKAHAYPNLVATGFVAGEGLATTSDWATITTVGACENTFAYTLLANTLADNYALAVATGALTVVKGAVQKEIEEAFGGGAVVEPMSDDGGSVTNYLVTVTDDLTGLVILPESVTGVIISMNGHGIVGLDGVTTEDGVGTDGAPAIVVSNAAAQLTIVGPGSVTGGKGGDGYPPGNGVPAVTDADGNEVTPAVIGDATVLRGADGTTWDPSAFGTVKYPKADASTGLVKAGSSATWTAKAGEGCVFTGWECTNGAPAAAFAALSENERRNTSLKLKIAAGEQVRPTDAEATWAWLDEDRIESVELTPSNLAVVCRSYVKASVSGLPSGLKFDKKTLAITGRAKKDGTKTVKVTVRNGSGYTWKESFDVTVEGGEVTKVASARGSRVQAGEPAVLWGEPSLGKVKGSKVVAAGKKVSIKATPAKNCIFLGWYEDPVFVNAATNLPKGYLAASQSVVVPEGGLKKLFARFVALEGWTVGTFDGVYYEDVGGTNVARGTVTLTVSNKGKVSGKTLFGGKSYFFKANALDDAVETGETGLVFVAHPTMKVDGKDTELELQLFENASTGLGMASVYYDDESYVPFAQAVQNGWKLKPSALPAFPTGKDALDEVSVTNGVDLTLTFGAKGVVKVAGTVDDAKVSVKSQMLPVARWAPDEEVHFRAQVPVYVPKADFFCEVYDVQLTVGADGEFDGASLAAVPSDGKVPVPPVPHPGPYPFVH